ncbi:MAG: hypothetical protein NT168_07330 [Planctomycetota bacterium]|nr:hypothetical protein [Planctomycetota bacterium]
MATITDDTLNRSFGSELFTNARYKPKQGRLVRQLTCLAIWLAWASMVVIFTMALLAALLFCYDAIWQWLFDTLGVS